MKVFLNYVLSLIIIIKIQIIYNYLDDDVKELMFIYEKKMKKIKPYEECFKDLEKEETEILGVLSSNISNFCFNLL